MRITTILILAAVTAVAADKKGYPGQAGNDNIELVGSVITDREEIRQAVGAELGEGFVLVRVKATPKTDESMRIGPSDFVLISRRDGDREEAMAPAQITSHSALTLKQDRSGRDWAQQTNRPGWTGIGGISRTAGPRKGAEEKKADAVDPKDEPKIAPSGDSANDDALLAALTAKQLPDKDTKGSIEGLLYFSMESSKIKKSKDLSLLYKGSGGRLTMDFR
jgi:hypothetical protein